MKYDFSKIAYLIGATNVYTDNFPKPLLQNALIDSKLDKKTEVQYLWKKYGSNEALIITLDFISFVNENKYPIIFHFDEISRVYFSPDTLFYLYNLKGDRCGIIPARFFGLESKSSITEVNRDSIKDFINSRINKGSFDIDGDALYEITLSKINDLGDIDEIEKFDIGKQTEYADNVLEIYDSFIEKFGKDYIYYNLELYYANALRLKGAYDEALNIVNNILENFFDDIKQEIWFYLKADILINQNNDYDAIISLKQASNFINNSIEKIKLKKEINEFQNRFNDNFLNLPFQKRKFILIDKDMKSSPPNTFIVLDKNNLPKNLNFLTCNPKIEELFIAHPYNNNIYLPYSDYEETLFRDKFEEFSYFIQCLGAKSMTIKVAKGSKNSRDNLIKFSSSKDRKKSIDGTLGIKGFGINGGNNSEKNTETNINSHRVQISEDDTYYSRTQEFNPSKKPYLPSEMIWYYNESTWQWLYKQRITGTIKKHHDILSSKSSYSISKKENASLKKAYKNHINGGVSFMEYSTSASHNSAKDKNISKILESTFNENESIEWEIEIEFESLENLKDDNQPDEPINSNLKNASNEEAYKEIFLSILTDDGIIDEKERTILERFRERKSISKKRADELEKLILSNKVLTTDEQEYLEGYHEIRKYGQISEKERKILFRMASILGITEERMIELENNF